MYILLQNTVSYKRVVWTYTPQYDVIRTHTHTGFAHYHRV